MSSTPPQPEIVLPSLDVPQSFKAVDPATFSVRVEASGDNRVVFVAGEVDVLTAPLLWESLEETIAAGTGSVVVDLEGTTFIDSMGLGVVMRASKRLREAGRPFSLRSLQPPVRKIFAITRLDSAVDIA